MAEKYKWVTSIALPLLGVVIPVALYFNSIPERSLVFEVVSKTDLVGSLEGIDELEITIKDKPVKEAALYLVKLKNTGTEPITVSDFEKPIKLKLEGEIFSAKTKVKIPNNLSLEYSIEGENVIIKPFLFNSNEEFSLEILSSSKIYPIVDSRIAGIAGIKERYPSENQDILKLVLTLSLSFILMVFYSKSFGLLFERNNPSRLSEKISHYTLIITCGFSSLLLVKTVIDLEAYKWIVFASMLVPMSLGLYLAKFELRYKK
jgi:hypothetical protein